MNDGPKRIPSHWRLYSLIGLMTFLWALNFIVAKFAVRQIPPLMAVGFRTGLAGLLIWPIYFWERRRNGVAAWSVGDVPMLIFLGMFGVTLNQLFFVLGISHTSVAHAAIMIGMTPILVLAIASAIGQEALSAGKLLGMALAFAGVVTLQFSPSKGVVTTVAGDFFIFLASVTFALFTVMGKRVVGSFSSITINTFAYVGGGACLLPLTLWHSSGFPFRQLSWVTWASVLYMAVFPSALCYLIYYYALAHIPASRIAAFSYLQPLLATVLAIPLLGENPTASLVAGGCLVLVGVFVAERA